jgi:hypothetical protein
MLVEKLPEGITRRGLQQVMRFWQPCQKELSADLSNGSQQISIDDM